MSGLLQRIGISLPVIQAPMAGTSTPELAAAVTNAGALGSIAVGAVTAAAAAEMIRAVRALTPGPFNVNVFCHAPPVQDWPRAALWLQALAPEFARYGSVPPAALRNIYHSFLTDQDMLAVLLQTRPAVVSFHFGLPTEATIARLRAEGIILLATATNLHEAMAAQAAGVDGVVAQGIEAGGHRGVFDPAAPDAELTRRALTGLLARRIALPVIAAGGIMNGADIADAVRDGAVAAQLGTAFIACPESAADAAYRAALNNPGAGRTVMTRVISGRPARCLQNRFTELQHTCLANLVAPDYPLAYDAGKALNAAAKAHGEGGYGAQWAGQGVAHARAMPAGQLVAALRREFAETCSP